MSQLRSTTVRSVLRCTSLRSQIQAVTSSPQSTTIRYLSRSSIQTPKPLPDQTTSHPLSLTSRNKFYSTSTQQVQPPDYLNDAELSIFKKIAAALEPSKLEVQDISGGCGSMYALDIVSAKFKGLSVIKQHRLVNEVLGEEIKGWHGVQLKTKAD